MTARLVLVVALTILVCVNPSPAPIVEESTPPPKTVATPKPKPKENAPTRRTASSPKPVRSPFAGTWGGVGQAQGSDGGSGTFPYTIRVREDGRAIRITSKNGEGVSWTNDLTLQAEGGVLVARTGGANNQLTTYRLGLNQNGTLSLFRLDKFADGRTATLTATLIRQ